MMNVSLTNELATKGNITVEFEKISTAVIILVNCLGVVVVFLNVLVFLILVTQRRMFKQREFWLQLLILCLNDILAGFSIIVASFLDHPPFSTSRMGCRLALVIAIMSQITTVCHVIAIGWRRVRILRTINQPGPPWNTKYSLIQACSVLLIGLLFLTIATIAWPTEGDDQINGCEFSAAYGGYKSYATSFIGASIVIPLLITDALYIYLFVILRRLSRSILPVTDNVQDQATSSTSERNSSKTNATESLSFARLRRFRLERSATLVCAIVLLAINITTWPTLIMQMNTALFNTSFQIHRTTKLPIASIIILNSIANPFLYTLRVKEFRDAAVKYFSTLCRC